MVTLLAAGGWEELLDGDERSILGPAVRRPEWF
jgi:hypothetical protein